MKKAKTTKKTAKKSGVKKARSEESGNWRDEVLARMRAVILGADPEVFEEVKWRKPSNSMEGVPVWSHPACGIICTGEMYKAAVKLTFAKGASLADPSGLFNASLEGNTRRAIDIRDGDRINEKALKALVREAVKGSASARVAGRRSAAGGTRKQPKRG